MPFAPPAKRSHSAAKLFRPGIGQFRAHTGGMENDPSSFREIINARLIRGYSWGWMLEFEHIRLARFPGEPLVVWRKFDTFELAREAAVKLGPIPEIDESEYDFRTP